MKCIIVVTSCLIHTPFKLDCNKLRLGGIFVANQSDSLTFVKTSETSPGLLWCLFQTERLGIIFIAFMCFKGKISLLKHTTWPINKIVKDRYLSKTVQIINPATSSSIKNLKCQSKVQVFPRPYFKFKLWLFIDSGWVNNSVNVGVSMKN